MIIIQSKDGREGIALEEHERKDLCRRNVAALIAYRAQPPKPIEGGVTLKKHLHHLKPRPLRVPIKLEAVKPVPVPRAA